MFLNIGIARRKRYMALLLFALLMLLTLGVVTLTTANPRAASLGAVGANAGTWKTWVLTSGDQLRLDAPPDDAATADEITQLQDMAAKRDDAALQQIAYWNAGPPSYRWNHLAVNTLANHVNPLAVRNLALLHVAIYDATV